MAEATSRITEASARFMNALVAMEPGTQNSGIYTNKPGYHGTREENQARDRVDGDTNYSVELPLDLKGPGDKAAAYDWTFPSAQAGSYAGMAKYGKRLKAAFDARDPRLYGWREALGQTDTDRTSEGMDFVRWLLRTPDQSHEWHWHFAELRAFVESWVNKLCMLSILRGESLAEYLAGGGQLLEGAMGTFEEVWRTDQITNPYGDSLTNPTIWAQTALVNLCKDAMAAKADASRAVTEAAKAAAEAKAARLELAETRNTVTALKTELAEVKALVKAGGIDPALIRSAVADAVRDGLGDALRAGGQAVDPV